MFLRKKLRVIDNLTGATRETQLHYMTRTQKNLGFCEETPGIKFFQDRIRTESTSGLCGDKHELEDAFFNFQRYLGHPCHTGQFRFIQRENIFYTWKRPTAEMSLEERFSVRLWNFRRKNDPLHVINLPAILNPQIQKHYLTGKTQVSVSPRNG